MTIEHKLKTMLVERGLFDHEADTILEKFKQQPYNEVWGGRWNEDTENYPPAATAALSDALFDEVLEWIDANKPRVWYRQMFVL